MSKLQSLPIAELAALAGKLTVTSSWISVTQAMIDAFAEVTRDHQFIHVDPARAEAETPFGGTIAHGFLTLSLLSPMAIEVIPAPQGAKLSINYGFDKLRFLTPVRSGARIRGVFALIEVTERKPGEYLSRYQASVEIEGMQKPALVGEWLSLVWLGAA